MGLQLGMSPFWKLTIRTVFNYFARARFGKLPGKRPITAWIFKNIFGMGLELGMSPFLKLTIQTFFYYFARARFGRVPGKRQTLLFVFLKIFLVWACSWTCYHFQLFPTSQSLITFPRSSQVITVISGC